MTNYVLETIESGIQTLILNRPEKKNAITLEMYQSLTQALLKAKAEQEIKVSIITGEGGNFSAGNDLYDFVRLAQEPDDLNIIFNFLQVLSGHPKPLIAAVDGLAVGIGVTMLLHCDLVVASKVSQFMMPFTKLGLVPEAASSYLLPHVIGHQKAFELLVLGDRFDVSVANNAGIVNKVTDQNEVMSVAQSYASQLVALPCGAVQASKALLKQESAKNIDSVLANESEVFRERLMSDEAKKAFSDFLKGL